MSTSEPLSGFTVAIVADRCRDELAGMLERRGARVVLAPTLRVVPLAEDPDLRAVTGALVDNPPDIVVAGTGVGLRGWLQAARQWGLGDGLRTAIDSAYLLATGPTGGLCGGSGGTATDGLATDGLATGHAASGGGSGGAASDSATGPGDVLERLLRHGVAGARVAVQVHGEPQPELCAALVGAGAEVIEVAVHRWVPPADPTPLRRLVDLAVSRLVDAIAFTSAPAVGALLRLAGPDIDSLLAALRADVAAACLGAVSATPLVHRGVPVVAPARPRLAGLVAALVEELPERAPTILVAGREVVLRGHAALVDGKLRPLAPAPMAVLRALAATPGRVLSRAALLTSLPRGADEHAVEMAVARLRAALGGSAFVQTVVKRGYRLRVD
ncbi:uroporphyrinogen III methyltransferase [Rugosimonospora africana]|uniref:Uroporphyrinogen III methyltransferase n=1 Tax=Rugosimonospora africana TaxID=556532 RepID=A0A8J3VMC8_9ACTN|nr:uroporphyrinogen III methyltransferase [Rugosimonospora africana]